MQNKRLILFLFLCVIVSSICSGYSVKGTLKNVSAFYYPKVYLAVIDDIQGFNHGSPERTIISAPIDSNGNFVLTGNELPDEKLYYRLYLTSDSNIKSEIRMGAGRNYIVLILNNNSNVTLNCDDFCKKFFRYTLNDSSDCNANMLHLQNMILDYDEFYANENKLNISNSKETFVDNKLESNIKHFIDTNKNFLADLYAIDNINIDSAFKKDPALYDLFIKRFKKSNNPTYIKQLEQKDDSLEGPTTIHRLRFALIAVSILFISVLLFLVFFLMKRKQPVNKANNNNSSENANTLSIIASLTIKEREVLALINNGLSNKEIANNLNVEVTTIKSHVSNIYQKANIKSRKEVAQIARYL